MSKRSDLQAAEAEKIAAEIRVGFPARVLAFHSESMTVDVQPLNRELIDGKYSTASPIMGLRVACLCAGSFTIRPWYTRDDIGFVIVGDSDADTVWQTGRESDPNTARKHAPEDGIFLGGLCPVGSAPAGLPDNALVLAADNNFLAISPSGITIQGNVTINGTLSAAGIEMTTHSHTAPMGETSGPHSP